jgi:predicted metal-dependent peptidase
MIKLFRKIRHKLLSENKFTQYLIYSIGEIFLVVIGILIALQININNNDKEQRITEQEYLKSLQTEFRLNLENLNTAIHENDVREKALSDLLTLFDVSVLDTVSNQSISSLLHP